MDNFTNYECKSLVSLNIDEKPKREYKFVDFIVALFVIFVGYLFVKFVLFSGYGIGITIFDIALISVSAIYYKLKKIKFSFPFILYMSISAVFSVAPIINASPQISMISTLMVLSLYAYSFFVGGGNRRENHIGDMALADFFKASIVIPITNMGAIFGALTNGNKKTKKLKNLFQVFIGIIIAIVPTMIITFLLMFADSAFEQVMDNIFRFDFGSLKISMELKYLMLGLPAAIYIFGFLYACSENYGNKSADDPAINEKNKNLIKKIAFCPETIVYSSVTPIMIIYVIFFASQLMYFTSAFSNILPEEFTYSSYARRGFFELCIVSCINAAIIICICVFTQRNESGKRTKIQKGYVITLSVFTLILISTAVSKMLMYISNYGLTQLRVYTTWFMILMGMIFIFVIIRQISSKFNISLASAAAIIAMTAVLCFSNIDSIIAKYNVDAYLSGKLDTVDIYAMYDLSDAAVPYVIPLTEDKNTEISLAAKDYLRNYLDIRESGSNFNWYNFNITSMRADNAIKEADIDEWNY